MLLNTYFTRRIVSVQQPGEIYHSSVITSGTTDATFRTCQDVGRTATFITQNVGLTGGTHGRGSFWCIYCFSRGRRIWEELRAVDASS